MSSQIRKNYAYIDQNGEENMIRINATNVKEADKKFQQFVNGGIRPQRRAPCLEAFVKDVYRPSFISCLKPKTVANYEIYLSCYILPFLGNTPMHEITVATIQQFQNWMAEGAKHGMKKNLNAKTIDRVCGLTSRIFKVAKEMKLIEDTPFKSTLLKNPGEEAGHHQALPDEEIKRIRSEYPLLEDAQQRAYMALLVDSGIRREELLGLRWEDLNFDKRYGRIVRAVTYPGNNKPHVDTPKTSSSHRTFPLPQSVVNVLKPIAKPSGYLFGGEKPLCYSTASRLYRKAFQNLHIVGYNNHDFRTTFGTQLKENGVTSANVASLLGHADTRMVETIYARTRHESVTKQLDTVEALTAMN